MPKPDPDKAEQRVISGETWREFCRTLEKAGEIIVNDSAPQSAFDRAEGLRYLSRLTRAALETFVENADPQAPELVRTCHETIKMGADNPDNHYQNAPISGKYEYRIRGNRGTVHYLGFGTQAGNYGATGSLEPTGYLESADMEIAEDGSFEIIVSRNDHAGNWLPMTPETRTLVVRQTFLDKNGEVPAQLSIERIDGAHAPRPITAFSIDRGLHAAGRFVAGCANLFSLWAGAMTRHTNELPRFDAEVAGRAGGDPNIVYHHSYWRIATDEALIVEVTPPPCDYWNFQINNHWMESLDYRYFPISLNKHSAHLASDGSVRIVVAHHDPGCGNWLSTCGHDRGTMCWRWIRADDPPQPRTRVVKLGELT